jgi:dTDP-4-amino-4,6-dideoxygalactose transaminase
MERSLVTATRPRTPPPNRRAQAVRVGSPLKPVIPLQHPELPPPEEILRYYELAREASFYSNGGPCATLLSESLSSYLGVHTRSVPVSNCTTGLMVALRAACGQPTQHRRRVLCPAYTFTATGCAIAWSGFEPVFVDVDLDGWHMDPNELDGALREYAGTVAGVLACATFGTAPPNEQRAAWRTSCESHGVPLLIDAAPGFGALDEDGRRIGGLGDTEIFSFHATKPFAIGEGGLIVPKDAELEQRIMRLMNFGLARSSRASTEIGLNAKMSELHAATALAMLDGFDDVLRRRRANAERLRGASAHLPFTFQRGSSRSTWQILPLLAPSAAVRTRCLELAPKHGIEIRTMHDPALHRQPAFAGFAHGHLEVTDSLAERALALPMANELPEDAFERIPALLEAAVSEST